MFDGVANALQPMNKEKMIDGLKLSPALVIVSSDNTCGTVRRLVCGRFVCERSGFSHPQFIFIILDELGRHFCRKNSFSHVRARIFWVRSKEYVNS